MQVHKFIKKQGSAVILTSDRLGSNLPEGTDAWTFQKSLEVSDVDPPRIGASSKEIIDGINADGFFIWPDGGSDAQRP